MNDDNQNENLEPQQTAESTEKKAVVAPKTVRTPKATVAVTRKPRVTKPAENTVAHETPIEIVKVELEQNKNDDYISIEEIMSDKEFKKLKKKFSKIKKKEKTKKVKTKEKTKKAKKKAKNKVKKQKAKAKKIAKKKANSKKKSSGKKKKK